MGRWDKELIPLLPKSCKISASAGAGFDWVDVDLLAERGKCIPVAVDNPPKTRQQRQLTPSSTGLLKSVTSIQRNLTPIELLHSSVRDLIPTSGTLSSSTGFMESSFGRNSLSWPWSSTSCTSFVHPAMSTTRGPVEIDRQTPFQKQSCLSFETGD